MSLKRKARDLIGDKKGPVWASIAKDFDPTSFGVLEERGRDRPAIIAQLKSDLPSFVKNYWDGRLFGNCVLEEGGPDTVLRHCSRWR